MKNRAATMIALLAAACALLAGCTSSSSPGKHASSGATTGARPTGPAPGPVSAAKLAAELRTALDGLSSAHLNVDAGALGGVSTADVKLQGGHATATDVHLEQSGQHVEMITIGSKSYVKIPAVANRTGKPWVLVTPSSNNPIARALASGLNVAGLTSSLDVIPGLVKSATDARIVGGARVGGVQTTHYTMKINPTKGTGNPRLDSLLRALGTAPVPVDLWLDDQHRPVRFVIHVSIAGTAFPVTVEASRFDAPVTIAAPPANEVATA